MIIEIFSAVALGTTIISLVPQVYKTYKTKSAQDLSMLMLINFAVSSLAWIGYGILLEDVTVILANIFCATTALISMCQKIYYDKFDAYHEQINRRDVVIAKKNHRF